MLVYKTVSEIMCALTGAPRIHQPQKWPVPTRILEEVGERTFVYSAHMRHTQNTTMLDGHLRYTRMKSYTQIIAKDDNSKVNIHQLSSIHHFMHCLGLPLHWYTEAVYNVAAVLGSGNKSYVTTTGTLLCECGVRPLWKRSPSAYACGRPSHLKSGLRPYPSWDHFYTGATYSLRTLVRPHTHFNRAHLYIYGSTADARTALA